MRPQPACPMAAVAIIVSSDRSVREFCWFAWSASAMSSASILVDHACPLVGPRNRNDGCSSAIGGFVKLRALPLANRNLTGSRIKSAAGPAAAGIKIGSCFLGNDALDLPRHNSLILLFDQTRGRIGTIVEAGTLNAFRTAATDAVATDILARPEAEVLAIFGTGHQAEYEVAALSRIRRLRRVLVVGRAQSSSLAMVGHLNVAGIAAEMSEAEAACRCSDIIVTATGATAPLFRADWVRDGTHVSTMGSDAIGKQELPVPLLAAARLFCDLPTQSRAVGEFQHAPSDASLIAIGEVLRGTAPGRQSAEQIAVFDSSGLSLQDSYVALAVLGESDRQQEGGRPL